MLIKKNKSHISHLGFTAFTQNKLWSCLTEPKRNDKKICVIFCYPLLEGRVNSYPYYVHFGKMFSENGIATFRFDFLGTGESMPPNQPGTLEFYSNQLAEVINYFRSLNKYDRIGVFAVDSAWLILSALSEETILDFIISIEPILENKNYIRYIFQANILEQRNIYGEMRFNSKSLENLLDNGETFPVEGHQINIDFINSLSSVDCSSVFKNRDCPMKILFIKKMSFNYATKSIGSYGKESIYLLEKPDILPFWLTSNMKYPKLPIQAIKECAGWLLSI